jgi:hypothetical protein
VLPTDAALAWRQAPVRQVAWNLGVSNQERRVCVRRAEQAATNVPPAPRRSGERGGVQMRGELSRRAERAADQQTSEHRCSAVRPCAAACTQDPHRGCDLSRPEQCVRLLTRMGPVTLVSDLELAAQLTSADGENWRWLASREQLLQTREAGGPTSSQVSCADRRLAGGSGALEPMTPSRLSLVACSLHSGRFIGLEDRAEKGFSICTLTPVV